jgi:cytochrome c oxidase subunit IV
MSEPVVSRRTYAFVYLALLLLTGLTTAVAFVDLGAMSTVVAVLIAAIKAAIIALFFMHLLHSEHLVRVIGIGALIWFGFMLTLTIGDYVTRGWVPVPGR